MMEVLRVLSLKDVPGGVVTYIDGTKKTPRTEKPVFGVKRNLVC